MRSGQRRTESAVRLMRGFEVIVLDWGDDDGGRSSIEHNAAERS
jgi:hypothetical protein